MLAAVSGYIDEDRVIVDENISEWKGRKVIVTVLDSVYNSRTSEVQGNNKIETRKAAAMELSGLWKDHKCELSVEETVRSMRKGRRFDN